jgi:hypothetical protein
MLKMMQTDLHSGGDVSKIGANPRAIGALLAGFGLLCAPLVGRDVAVFDDLDERLFHLPSIQQFMEQLPTPNLVDYPSATTPLYHLVLAGVGLIIGEDVGGLRVINLLISLCALGTAAWAMGRSGALLALPLALSPYFVGPAVRLSTDNAALLGVFLSLGLLQAERERPLSAGLAAAAAVMTRQIHAWILGLLLLRAVRRPSTQAWAAAAVPAGLLGATVWMWGSLTPPGFASGHSRGLNPDTLVFALAIFGLYGVFFVGWLWPAARTHWRRLAGAAGLSWVGLALHAMPYIEDPNRWGGAVWQLAARTPELLQVNLSFWVLVPLGAAVIATIASTAKPGSMVGLTVALWLLANLASGRAYQKYYDPMTLFILGLSVRQLTGHRLAWLGPAALSLGLGAVTWLRFYG